MYTASPEIIQKQLIKDIASKNLFIVYNSNIDLYGNNREFKIS